MPETAVKAPRIDASVHPNFAANDDIREFLKLPWSNRAIPGVEKVYYTAPGGDYAAGLRPGAEHPASDPAVVSQELFEAQRLDAAVLRADRPRDQPGPASGLGDLRCDQRLAGAALAGRGQPTRPVSRQHPREPGRRGGGGPRDRALGRPSADGPGRRAGRVARALRQAAVLADLEDGGTSPPPGRHPHRGRHRHRLPADHRRLAAHPRDVRGPRPAQRPLPPLQPDRRRGLRTPRRPRVRLRRRRRRLPDVLRLAL